MTNLKVSFNKAFDFNSQLKSNFNNNIISNKDKNNENI
jgi:hypothetical protein